MPKLFNSKEDIIEVKNNGSECLGSGSFSKVNLVCHRNRPNQLFAMKIVNKRTDKERQLIFKEINLHMNLDHKNVVKFEDYLETEDKVYIFLEYAQNGDLFGYIQKNKLTEKQRMIFFYQTCLAIQYIHSKNIMHRDLKPENILLDADLNVKLCDFGWSTEYYEFENRETLCGTYEYMAPEIFFRNKQSRKTDVWALGILLFELFHGQAPFRGTRMDTVMHAIMRNIVAFKKTLRSEIKDLIIKILIFDPKKRPNINEVLRDPLLVELARGSTYKCIEKENQDTKHNLKEPEEKRQNKAETKNFIHKKSNNYVSVSTSQQKGNFGSYFKKKTKAEKVYNQKHFTSVEKYNSGSKCYNPSKYNRHKITLTPNVYSTKYTTNSSFNSKLPSQKTICYATDIYTHSSHFSTLNYNESGEQGRYNTIYNKSFSNYKNNPIHKSSRLHEKSFGGYLKRRKFVH